MSIGPIEDTARALSHWRLRHEAMSNNLANTATTGSAKLSIPAVPMPRMLNEAAA